MSSTEALRILGLDEKCSKDEIVKVYRKLAKRHHPDVGGSEEMMKRLNEAYNIALDWEKKRSVKTNNTYKHTNYSSSHSSTGVNNSGSASNRARSQHGYNTYSKSWADSFWDEYSSNSTKHSNKYKSYERYTDNDRKKHCTKSFIGSKQKSNTKTQPDVDKAERDLNKEYRKSIYANSKKEYTKIVLYIIYLILSIMLVHIGCKYTSLHMHNFIGLACVKIAKYIVYIVLALYFINSVDRSIGNIKFNKSAYRLHMQFQIKDNQCILVLRRYDTIVGKYIISNYINRQMWTDIKDMWDDLFSSNTIYSDTRPDKSNNTINDSTQVEACFVDRTEDFIFSEDCPYINDLFGSGYVVVVPGAYLIVSDGQIKIYIMDNLDLEISESYLYRLGMTRIVYKAEFKTTESNNFIIYYSKPTYFWDYMVI